MTHNYAKCESEKLIVPLSEKTVQFKKKYDLYPAFSTLKRLDDLKISSFTVNIGQQERKFIVTNTLSLGFLFGEPIKMNTITTRIASKYKNTHDAFYVTNILGIHSQGKTFCYLNGLLQNWENCEIRKDFIKYNPWHYIFYKII